MSDLISDQLVNAVGTNNISTSPCWEWGVSYWSEATSYWGLLDYPKGGFIGDTLAAGVTISDTAVRNLGSDGLAANVSIVDVQL